MKNELGIEKCCENCHAYDPTNDNNDSFCWYGGCRVESESDESMFMPSHEALEARIVELKAKLNCPDIGEFMRAISIATQLKEMERYPATKGVLLKVLGFFSALKHDREYVSVVEAKCKKYEAFIRKARHLPQSRIATMMLHDEARALLESEGI